MTQKALKKLSPIQIPTWADDVAWSSPESLPDSDSRSVESLPKEESAIEVYKSELTPEVTLRSVEILQRILLFF